MRAPAVRVRVENLLTRQQRPSIGELLHHFFLARPELQARELRASLVVEVPVAGQDLQSRQRDIFGPSESRLLPCPGAVCTMPVPSVVVT